MYENRIPDAIAHKGDWAMLLRWNGEEAPPHVEVGDEVRVMWDEGIQFGLIREVKKEAKRVLVRFEEIPKPRIIPKAYNMGILLNDEHGNMPDVKMGDLVDVLFERGLGTMRCVGVSTVGKHTWVHFDRPERKSL